MKSVLMKGIFWRVFSRKGLFMSKYRLTLLCSIILAGVLTLSGCASPAEEPGKLAGEHLEAGKQAMERGDHGRAVEEFQSAVAADSNLFEAHFRLGNALAALNRLPEAESAYKKALAMEPDDADALSNLGVVYYRMERFDEAIAHIRHALELKPDDAELHYNLGGVYFQKNQLESALEEFEIARSLDPALPEVYLGLGFAYKELGRNEEAISALEQFLKMSDDPTWSQYARNTLDEVRGLK